MIFRLNVGKITSNSLHQSASMRNNVTLNNLSFRGEEVVVSVGYENPKSRLKTTLRCKIKNRTNHPPFIYKVPIRNEKYEGDAGIAGLVRGNLYIDLRDLKLMILVHFPGN